MISSGESHDQVRLAMIGCVISALFGALWSIGAASVLLGRSVPAGVVVAVVGVVLGVGTAVAALRVRRRLGNASAAGTPDRGHGMFGSQAYRITVAAEVVAIVGGGILLGRLGLGQYAVLWVAAVVGVHFVIFGRLFAARFYLVGAVLILGALIGLLLALLVAPAVGQLVTPAVAALDLLVAGLVPVVAASRTRS